MAKLISKTYGDALFEVAAEEDKLESHLEEVEAVLDVLKENEEDILPVVLGGWQHVLFLRYLEKKKSRRKGTVRKTC